MSAKKKEKALTIHTKDILLKTSPRILPRSGGGYMEDMKYNRRKWKRDTRREIEAE